MKRLFVSLIVAVMLFGCAGLGIKDAPVLLSEYYQTDTEGVTTKLDMEADVELVKYIESEGTTDVIYTWIDYRHDILAFKLVVEETEYCTVFWVQGVAGAFTPEFQSYPPVQQQMIPCESMDAALVTQLERE